YLLFHESRYHEYKQVADRPRDEIFLVLVVILALLEATECLGDIAGNGGLLCNYERLGHGGWQSNPVTGLLQVGDVFQLGVCGEARITAYLSQLYKIFSR